MKARLLLADGVVYEGISFGAEGTAAGEVVFNTALTGYQEIITDPSYHFQLIAMTYPQIGNYGINGCDYESRRIFAAGLIVREYSPAVSHWQAEKSLGDYLSENNIVGISEIDTRALTRHLRSCGAQMGMITTSEDDESVLMKKLQESGAIVGRDIVQEVTADAPYEWTVDNGAEEKSGQTSFRVAVYDFGVKYSILRRLHGAGCKIRVFPAATPADEILAWNPDGVFLSNGPGDPEPLDYVVRSVRMLLNKKPLFGICLGHQILGIALGGKTVKLKFGHHGANHPVHYLPNGSIEITSQNHGFAVDADSLPNAEVDITHINLNDGTLEGFRHRSIPAFSVQYHPEAAPGPHDSRYLFEQFFNDIRNVRA